MKRSLFWLLLLVFIAGTGISFAQPITVTYKPLSPNFFLDYPGRIPFAFLKFEGKGDVETVLYERMRKTSFWDKFEGYSYAWLEEYKKDMLEYTGELNPRDPAVQQRLKENLLMKLIAFGEAEPDANKFTMRILDLQSGEEIFTQQYQTSETSTAIEDAVKLFLEYKLPVYTKMPSDAVISGIIKDSGTEKPIEGVQIKSSLGAVTTSDNEGNYSLKVPAGEQSIIISKPGYQTVNPNGKFAYGKKYPINYNLSYIGCTFTGVVKDETGNPLSGVKITSDDGATTKTDESGKYSLLANSGNKRIEFSLPRYIAVYETDETEAGEIIELDVELEKLSTIEMVFVEGGTYAMGSENGSGGTFVTVSSFYIGKYEVTQKEWEDVMGNNPSYFSVDRKPVEDVTYEAAIEYCNKRSILEGLTPVYSGSDETPVVNWTANGYRLPTEEEWEFAARGGNKSKGFIYSGSNDVGDVAETGKSTSKVGSYDPNELGIFDMSGNVLEICLNGEIRSFNCWAVRYFQSNFPQWEDCGIGFRLAQCRSNP